MAVSEQTPYIEYVANGMTSTFALGFECSNSEFLIVKKDGVVVDTSTWSLVDNSIVFNEPPSINTKFVFERNSAIERSTNFQTADNSFRPSALNNNLDYIIYILQEIAARLVREIGDRKLSDSQLTQYVKDYVESVLSINNPEAITLVVADIVQTSIDGDIQTQQEFNEYVLNYINTKYPSITEFLDEVETSFNNFTSTNQTLINNFVSANQTTINNSVAQAQTDVNNSIATIQPTVNAAVANAGNMIGSANKAALDLITDKPVNQNAMLDNGDIYRWNGTIWVSTGLNYFNFANSNPMFKAVPVVAGNNTNNFNVPGMYTLSANLATGNITNWPQDNGGFHQAGAIFVQGITVAGVKLVTQIFYPYVNLYEMKVRRQTNSAGAWESTWSTLSTFEKLNTIFAKPSDLVANNIALLSELGRYAFFGKQFTNAEIVGTNAYTTNTYYVGLNAIHTSAINGNKLKARIWNTTLGDVEYRVFTGTAVTSSANGYFVSSANTGNFSFSGTCKAFPRADNGIDNVIEFDQIISIPTNTPFVIAFKHTTLATFRIGHHTALSGNLVSRGFNLGATNTAGWALNIGATNPVSFLETGFQLFLDIVSSSGSSSAYVPTAILPPKIYCLEGLESHVYPENIVQGNYKFYDYDVTCAKGIQKERGWVYTPNYSEASGMFPFSVSVSDMQSGLQLASASSEVILANKNAYAGVSKTVCFIADSLGQAGVITQRLLDIDAVDDMNINLIGTRGTGLNKHEGRGGWTIADYTGAGRTNYRFTVSGVVAQPAINATTYTFGGSTFLVQELAISGGSGTVTCSLSSGSAPTAGSSGTLTKSNVSAGDATIAFTDVQPIAGNPFWNGTAINFSDYLINNSFVAPDVVFIQLGINDTFSMTSDSAVEAFTATAFTSLDVLINSIKAANSGTKVAVCAPPSYANQDAFGYNYQNNQTSRRAKRNIITFNKQLYNYYKSKEAQNIYVVGSGVNVDSENNYPVSSAGVPVNSHNSKLEYPQVNGVHPADSGYKQIGDVFFSFLKAV